MQFRRAPPVSRFRRRLWPLVHSRVSPFPLLLVLVVAKPPLANHVLALVPVVLVHLPLVAEALLVPVLVLVLVPQVVLAPVAVADCANPLVDAKAVVAVATKTTYVQQK